MPELSEVATHLGESAVSSAETEARLLHPGAVQVVAVTVTQVLHPSRAVSYHVNQSAHLSAEAAAEIASGWLTRRDEIGREDQS